jgi:glycogen(starch) synthase
VRIVVASIVYSPSMGGVETVASLIVEGLRSIGHEVEVVTHTESPAEFPQDSGIWRRPSVFRLLWLLVRCDAAILMGASLRLGWPLLIVPRPALMSHHILLDQKAGIRHWLRQLLVRCFRHVACSQFLAGKLPFETTVIGNPYEVRVFRSQGWSERAVDLVFLGRLIPDKGLSILLRALQLLSQRGRRPLLNVVGDGPARRDLEAEVSSLNLRGQVCFKGIVTGTNLARLLQEHQILVIPSTWDEPFGVVALEAIACGCVVVGSSAGGIPEAIGPCGVIFRRGDAADLAVKLETLLLNPNTVSSLRQNASNHLKAHDPVSVSENYLGQISQKI